MKRFFRCISKFAGVGAVGVVALLCVACGSDNSTFRSNNPIQSVNTAMGTIVSQTIYVNTDAETKESADTGKTSKITDDILLTIKDLEEKLLSWRLDSSQLYQVNSSAGQPEGILLSQELSNYIGKCLEVSEDSQGALDITIGEVVRLWNIDRWAESEEASDYVMPTAEEIHDKLENSGYEKLVLQENHLIVPAGLQLDLGAVGKGIALDRLHEYLVEHREVSAAVISVGGSILTYGQKDDGTPWRVGVVNPSDSAKNIGYLEIKGQWCVSTSGDYERYVEVDGTRYHHIIDPSTGYPADSGLHSVTILTQNGLLSDALSTACFILGEEQGMQLAEAYEAEAVFVDYEGNISMTEGMEKYFKIYE